MPTLLLYHKREVHTKQINKYINKFLDLLPCDLYIKHLHSPGYFLLTCHDSLHPYCLFQLHYKASPNRLHYSRSPTLFPKLCVLEVTVAFPRHKEHCSTSTAIWCHILKQGLLCNKNACKYKQQTLMRHATAFNTRIQTRERSQTKLVINKNSFINIATCFSTLSSHYQATVKNRDIYAIKSTSNFNVMALSTACKANCGLAATTVLLGGTASLSHVGTVSCWTDFLHGLSSFGMLHSTDWWSKLLTFWENLSVPMGQAVQGLSLPRTAHVNIFEGERPNCWYFLEKFFWMWETRVYQHHISDYSSDVLAPLIGCCPGGKNWFHWQIEAWCKIKRNTSSQYGTNLVSVRLQ